mgnify:CR=1 FL=1
MRTFKPGYLLMEALVALFILAVVTLPWINFLKEINTQNTLTRVDRFFLTKRFFLEALSNPALKGTHADQLGDVRIVRTPRADGLVQLQVNLVEKGNILVSLVGITR